MKLTFLIAAALAAAPAFAQAPKLPESIERLAHTAKSTAEVTLDGPMLKLAARFLSDKESGEAHAKHALEGIEGIYVRSFEFDREAAYSEADLKDLRAQYAAPGWSRIVGVRGADAGDNADIYLKISAAGELGGAAVISAGARELTIVSITGKIDPAQLRDLGGNFHIPRLELGARSEWRMEP